MSMIFSDIDGTIYGADKKVHKDMFPNIKEAKKASVMFNIATGNGMWPKIIELGKSLGAKYLINSNGAGIYDLVEGKSIYTNMISKEDAQKVLEIANKYELGVDWWDEKNLYFNKYASKELKTIVMNMDIVKQWASDHNVTDQLKNIDHLLVQFVLNSGKK